MRSYYLIIGFLLYCSTITLAHNPDQITYVFGQEKGKTSLKILLTVQSAIDLLEYLKPERIDEKVISLHKHYQDFAIYFKNRIELLLNNEEVQFRFIDADLKHHDAWLLFELDEPVTSLDVYEISVLSFIEIYQNVINHVKVEASSGIKSHVLSQYKRTCFAEHLDRSKMIDQQKLSLMPYTLLICLGGMGVFLWIYFTKQPKLDHKP